ncbi:MAG: SMP-30/gluconolactonase/LRE family protein [Myxococcales bacterium]|nr:SMP-30/gluconolactonase/LRE family protein [Myxococcales bacterium]
MDRCGKTRQKTGWWSVVGGLVVLGVAGCDSGGGSDGAGAGGTDIGNPGSLADVVSSVSDSSVWPAYDAGSGGPWVFPDGGGEPIVDVVTNSDSGGGAEDVSVTDSGPEPTDSGNWTWDGFGDIIPPVGTGCDDPPDPPFPFTEVPGFGGSEDFAFDHDGGIVYTNNGNLIRKTLDGQIDILVPNIGGTAGTSVLPNGNIVVAKGNELILVYKEGGSKPLLSGLSYPNGMDVDQDNYVYVAEQSGGRLRKVNGETGEYEIIAENLTNPNGVGFAPGYGRVYVGSFGGGKVVAIDRNSDGTWGEPWLFAQINGDATVVGPPPEPIDPPPINFQPCEGKTIGSVCVASDGIKGKCIAASGPDACEKDAEPGLPKYVACEGLANGDTCKITYWGYDHIGKCKTPGGGNFDGCCIAAAGTGCAADKACEECVCGMDAYCCQNNWDGICAGEAIEQCAASCDCSSGTGGTGIPSCSAAPDPLAFCFGLNEGDLCAYVENPEKILGGRCRNVSGLNLSAPFPKSGVACVPPEYLKPPGGGGGGGGGLDGLNVDECGNVYVTEYVLGYIWRISPDGVIYKGVKLPSSWIPNIEFGHGVGGWDIYTMYVMNLNGNSIFAIQTGFRGKEIAMPPAGTFGD